jgi:hypothetical protein
MEGIWYRDPKNFLRFENLPKFVPSKSMTYTEQLNTIMRFALYFSVLVFLVKRNILAGYIVIFVALLTIFMYEFYSKNKKLQRELYDKINVMYDQSKESFCALPTPDNPFMNVLMNQYTEFPNRPNACDISNKKVQKQAETYFNKNLYREVDDIWSRKTNSRNWHTVPSSQIPNDRESFQTWLYKAPETCKENGISCYRNLYRSYKV